MADALSRLEAIDLPVIISTDQLAMEQCADEELKEILKGSSVLILRDI